MTERTYSISQAAAIIFGADVSGNPLPGKTKWLAIRLRRGDIPGFKAGRQWRMTQDDIDAAIAKLRPNVVHIPDVPSFAGMTRTSRRRLSA